MNFPDYIKTDWRSRGHTLLKFTSPNCKICEENWTSNKYYFDLEEQIEDSCSHDKNIECFMSSFNVWEYTQYEDESSSEGSNKSGSSSESEDELNDSVQQESEYEAPTGLSENIWKMWLQHWADWKEIYVNLSWIKRFKKYCYPEDVKWYENYVRWYPEILSYINYYESVKFDSEQDVPVRKGKKRTEKENEILDKMYDDFLAKRFWIHFRLFLCDMEFEITDELKKFFAEHGITQEPSKPVSSSANLEKLEQELGALELTEDDKEHKSKKKTKSKQKAVEKKTVEKKTGEKKTVEKKTEKKTEEEKTEEKETEEEKIDIKKSETKTFLPYGKRSGKKYYKDHIGLGWAIKHLLTLKEQSEQFNNHCNQQDNTGEKNKMPNGSAEVEEMGKKSTKSHPAGEVDGVQSEDTEDKDAEKKLNFEEKILQSERRSLGYFRKIFSRLLNKKINRIHLCEEEPMHLTRVSRESFFLPSQESLVKVNYEEDESRTFRSVNEKSQLITKQKFRKVEIEYMTEDQVDEVVGEIEESPGDDVVCRTVTYFDDNGEPKQVTKVPVEDSYYALNWHKKISKFLKEYYPMELVSDEEAPEDMKEEIVKYWQQRYRLFLKYDNGIKLDNESWYSVTPEMIAAHQALRLRCDVVIDAFCGAGGNAIQLAQTCNKVIAIDINEKTLALARRNAKVYGVEDRIDFICGDFFQLGPQLQADCVFISPPWGGLDYIQQESYDISKLGGKVDAIDLLEAAVEISTNVALYLPRNTNVLQILELASGVFEEPKVDFEYCHISNKRKGLTVYFGDLVYFGDGEAEEEEK